MAARKKQVGISSEGSQGRTSVSARTFGKTAGTRVGVMADWREAGAKGTGEKSPLGKSFRDGR